MDGIFSILKGLALFAVLCLLIWIQCLYANHMKKAAILKGYGDDAHAWAMCFWLGIIGGIYVIALPDLVQQGQNQQIISMLKEGHLHDKM